MTEITDRIAALAAADPATLTEAQDILDRVAVHLLAQGAPARDGAVYRFRAQGGKRDPIGLLLSDAEYAAGYPTEEADPLDMPGGRDPEAIGVPRLAAHRRLLVLLCSRHDHPPMWGSPETIKVHLRDVALRSGLSADLIDAI